MKFIYYIDFLILNKVTILSLKFVVNNRLKFKFYDYIKFTFSCYN